MSKSKIEIVIELSDNELKIVTEDELREMEIDALKFDGFEGWIVRGRLEKFTNKKTPKIDFKKLLLFLNQKTGRNFKVVTPAVKSKYRARLKEGYTKQVILQAITNACQTPYHQENGYQYLTIGFFARAQTLDKYGYLTNEKKVQKANNENNKTYGIPVTE